MHVPISQSVVFGGIGGLSSSVLSMLQWARTPREQRPVSPLRDSAFWTLVVLLPVLGGFLVFLYERSGVTFTPILAVNVGASAPIIIQQLVSTAAPVGKVG